MSRLAAILLALLTVALVVVPLGASLLGAGAARVSADDDRTVRSTGARVFVGGGIRSGK